MLQEKRYLSVLFQRSSQHFLKGRGKLIFYLMERFKTRWNRRSVRQLNTTVIKNVAKTLKSKDSKSRKIMATAICLFILYPSFYTSEVFSFFFFVCSNDQRRS